MRILDTHLHLIYKDRFSYPWLDGAPAINRQWTAEGYFAEASALGIDGALHMEVDVAEDDIEGETAFVLSAHPNILGAIAACRPESEGFAAQLDRLRALRKVQGLRRILHTSPDELSQSALFVDNIRRLSGTGIPFDICVLQRQLGVGRALAARCPEVQFVLDHCGVPDIAGGDIESWRAGITALAELPNVAAKISGIVAYGGPDWGVSTLRPYFEHVIERFGWHRVVWGSDFPVCTLTANLTQWVGATETLLSGASEDEKSALLFRNAERIYHVEMKRA